MENQELPSEPGIGAGSGVGPLLKATRERRGENLAYVAEALRIRQAYLEAIEAGRFQQLPGSTYAVGFIRGYAEYLGLDSKEIVRRFHQENAEFSNRAELVFPSAVSEGSIPSGSLLLVALVAAAGLYGAWYLYQSRESSIAQAVPALPERLVALLHRPVGSGQELVPVNQADSAKINEAPLPGQTGPVPTTPPLLGGHEDVVPPAEDDGTSNAAPAQQPLPQGSAPVTTSQTPAQSLATQTPATQSALPEKAPLPAARPAEPPADAAVTPPDANAVQPPARKGRGRDRQPTADQTATPAPAGAAGTASPAAPTSSPVIPPAAAPTAPASQSPTPAPQPADSPADAGGPGRTVLKASEDCWIEIRDGKGHVIQSRLLRKGESYSVTRRPGMHMTVGNAGALSMSVDGKDTGPLGATGMVRKGVTLDGSRPAEPPAPEAAPQAAPETPAEPATPPAQ